MPKYRRWLIAVTSMSEFPQEKRVVYKYAERLHKMFEWTKNLSKKKVQRSLHESPVNLSAFKIAFTTSR